MKKQRDFAGNILGALVMALFALALALLFGAGGAPQPIAGASEPTPTGDTTSTETPLSLRAEQVRILEDYYMRPDVEGDVRFSDWSPDGAKIVFTVDLGEGIVNPIQPESEPLSVYHLWLANADGSSPRELASNGYWPLWSPSGGKIAFVVMVGYRQAELWCINLDSGQKHKIMDSDFFRAYWLTDETLIFSTEGQLKLIDEDGSNLRNLDIPELEETDHGWFAISPDKQKIAFHATPGLWLGKLEEERVRDLKVVYLSVRDIVWSPTSDKIAFSVDNDTAIVIADADGNEMARLDLWWEHGLEYGYGLRWSPNGNVLLFIPGREEALYVLNTDGTGLCPLLKERWTNKSYPRWSPDGRKIAFSELWKGGQRAIRVLEIGK